MLWFTSKRRSIFSRSDLSETSVTSSESGTPPPPYSRRHTTDRQSYSSGSTNGGSSNLQHFDSTPSGQKLCPEWVEDQASSQCLKKYTIKPISTGTTARGPCDAFTCTFEIESLMKVNWITLHLIMQEYRRHGLQRKSLTTLNLAGSHRRKIPQIVKTTWAYVYLECKYNMSSTARVVDERLILKISTLLRLSHDVKIDEHQIADFIKPMTCAHGRYMRSWENYTGYQIGKYLTDFIDRRDNLCPQDGELHSEKCESCSSEYVVIVRNKRHGESPTVSKNSRVFQVDRYLDFGECRAADLKEWNALTKHGKGSEHYTRETSPKEMWERAEREEGKA